VTVSFRGLRIEERDRRGNPNPDESHPDNQAHPGLKTGDVNLVTQWGVRNPPRRQVRTKSGQPIPECIKGSRKTDNDDDALRSVQHGSSHDPMILQLIAEFVSPPGGAIALLDDVLRPANPQKAVVDDQTIFEGQLSATDEP
jgi:hypothetical protein